MTPSQMSWQLSPSLALWDWQAQGHSQGLAAAQPSGIPKEVRQPSLARELVALPPTPVTAGERVSFLQRKHPISRHTAFDVTSPT